MKNTAMTDMQAVLDKMDSALVDRFDGTNILRADFKAAFDKVANPTNWKLPIDAEANLESDIDRYVMRQAVIFFTASVPEIFPVAPGRYRVMAAGYYAACGA